MTINAGLLACWPFTVTVNVPDKAPVGTIATIVESDQLVTTARVPFSEIVLLPWEAPNPVPVSVTGLPIGLAAGDMLVIVGDCA